MCVRVKNRSVVMYVCIYAGGFYITLGMVDHAQIGKAIGSFIIHMHDYVIFECI